MANRDTLVEITPEVLLKAYACGIFPMAESAEDPTLYWVEPDDRVAEAVRLVADRRLDDGRWPLHDAHHDPVAFDMERGSDQPSRWNTLRALRVLRWHAGSSF